MKQTCGTCYYFNGEKFEKLQFCDVKETEVLENWFCDKYKQKIETEINLRIEQEPINVKFECLYCDHENIYDYKDFCNSFGEPCDWIYAPLKCTKCNQTFRVSDLEWD